jgi:hypothetical protein
MILLRLDQLINPTTGISTQKFSTTENSRSGKMYTCNLHRMLTIFKLKNNLIDYDFDLPKANHLHNTRQRDHIHLSKPSTNWGKQKLLYQACKEYNDLNKNIKSINNLASFHTARVKSP